MADAADLKSVAGRREGSNPSTPTRLYTAARRYILDVKGEPKMEIIVQAKDYDSFVEALARRGVEPDVFIDPTKNYVVIHVDAHISLDDLEDYMPEDE